ncbi:hypothetical protein ABZW32_15705 [Streptomyces sp. NPDC004667]|uniref:hypothetical protein n=1 Tax=Streptomyces sp. NPDC004667 TaxID=3154285 RepID=UPI0033BDA705
MRFPYARRVVPAAAVIMLITSCGTGTGTGKDTHAGTAPSSAPRSQTPKPFDEGELAARLLTAQDLPSHKVEEAFQGAVVSSDKPECRDLATVLLGGVMTNTLGQVHTSATKGTTTTKVSLHSWSGTKAGSVLADVRAGGQACGGGFDAVSGTDKAKITKVVAAPATGGDESVAYSAEQEQDGVKSSIEVVLVRQGTTTATFTARSASGAAEPPAAVVAAQVKKLR